MPTARAQLAHVALPEGLAPALIGRLEQLLAQVSTTRAPVIVLDVEYAGPRCVVCHQAGKLSGHHASEGRIDWVHRSCHRRLHRRGSPRTRGARRRALAAALARR